MIKIVLYILDGQLDIEIKKNDEGYLLLVIMSQSDYFKEKGRVWKGTTIDGQKVKEMLDLIRGCSLNPSIPMKKTVNDGMMIKIKAKEEDSEIELIIRDIEEGMLEYELLQRVFQFVNALVQDNRLKKYTVIFGYKEEC